MYAREVWPSTVEQTAWSLVGLMSVPLTAETSSAWPDWVFNQALGELSGVFGVHLAALAAAYGLSVENDLASIIPHEDEPVGEDSGSL